MAFHARCCGIGLLAILGVGTGCPASDDEQTTAAESGSGGTDSSGGTGAGSATSTTSGGSMGGSASATSTSAGMGGDLPAACQAYCDKITECFPEDALPEDTCLVACQEDLLGEGPACEAASAEFYSCVGGLDCAALEGEQEHCIEEEAALERACGGDQLCEGGVGMGEGACEYTAICPDIDYRMVCDDTTCTCYEDDVEVASCDAMGICDAIDGISTFADDCCAWNL